MTNQIEKKVYHTHTLAPTVKKESERRGRGSWTSIGSNRPITFFGQRAPHPPTGRLNQFLYEIQYNLFIIIHYENPSIKDLGQPNIYPSAAPIATASHCPQDKAGDKRGSCIVVHLCKMDAQSAVSSCGVCVPVPASTNRPVRHTSSHEVDRSEMVCMTGILFPQSRAIVTSTSR